MVKLILIFIGFIAEQIERFNMVALRYYKTFCFRRRINPKIRHIGGTTKWNNIDNIYIGDNTYINGAELFTADGSSITIGDNCLISYGVVIRTDMHNHDLSLPIIYQGNSAKSVVIGDNVWIGYGAYIMPGVTIGDNTIIGAKAVVTRSVPENSIAVGIPARIVKERR